MRNISASCSRVIDPVTGSELIFDTFVSGKEGGYLYCFDFRVGHGASAVKMQMLLRAYTSLEVDARRRREGLPEFSSLTESIEFLVKFSEEFGLYLSVAELDLLEVGDFSESMAMGSPGCWRIDWSKISEESATSLVEALARSVFLARSGRPEGNGYYPDHLLVNPHRMPGGFVRRFQADRLMGI